MTHPNPKQCSKCERWFPPILLCFDKDASSSTGLQSWCVQCKDEWEADPQNIFRRMRAWLVKNEPIAWEQWEACPGGAEAEFRRKFGDRGCVCSTCGAGLREWQRSGHNLDRVDNNDGNLHTPQNTALACKPCNMTRGRKRYRAWLPVVGSLVSEYGWGRVAWGEEDDRFERVVWRRCSHLAVEAPPPPPVVERDPDQLILPLGGLALPFSLEAP